MFMLRQRGALCSILLLTLLLASCVPEEERSAEEWAAAALDALQGSKGLQYSGQWEGSRGGELVYKHEAWAAADSESVWQPVVPLEDVADMMESASFSSQAGNGDHVVVDISMNRSEYTDAMRTRMLRQFDALADQAAAQGGERRPLTEERELIEALWQEAEVEAVYTMSIRRDTGLPEQVEVEARLHYTSDGKNMQETIRSRYMLQPDSKQLVPEAAADGS
ncbi:hypothetical protein DUZ99_04065 [Xylanibacillus composti]|uniref:Uncharacterized protein n=1 Tax=Xylanibacillus composti TaxID=1572762 RepID=A0A8J4H383_9BACL|nr:hypothetical protein [Xylanibacillus composti]MDT9724162.1 hypothetical protein [Xylanibacillus composti]GIQ68711.1 hypothetical protein XYCOK13_15350 [Xylanibacillus composti]